MRKRVSLIRVGVDPLRLYCATIKCVSCCCEFGCTFTRCSLAWQCEICILVIILASSLRCKSDLLKNTGLLEQWRTWT